MADFQIDPNDPDFLTRFYRRMMGLPETFAGGVKPNTPAESAALRANPYAFTAPSERPMPKQAPSQRPAAPEGRIVSGKDSWKSSWDDPFSWWRKSAEGKESWKPSWPRQSGQTQNQMPDVDQMGNPLGTNYREPPAPEARPSGDEVRRGPDANMAPRTGMDRAPLRMPTRPGQQFSGPTPTPPRRDDSGGMHKVWYDKNMRRVGIGEKAPEGIDPEAYEMEPNKMSGFQRFVRGAYDVDESGNPAFMAGLFSKKAEGGSIGHAQRIAGEKSTPCHKGIIHMAVGGRTDHLPMNVLEGSYVLPADIVSGLGEGNTLAGGKILDGMFSGKQGPAGSRVPEFRSSPKFPELANKMPEDYMKYINAGRKMGQSMMGSQEKEQATPNARGGSITSHNRRPVPIIAAGGEYVIDPDDVMNYGGGDLDAGHEKLDQFVKFVRANTVKTLRKLPGPRKD